jgi:hypothetical protein
LTFVITRVRHPFSFWRKYRKLVGRATSRPISRRKRAAWGSIETCLRSHRPLGKLESLSCGGVHDRSAQSTAAGAAEKHHVARHHSDDKHVVFARSVCAAGGRVLWRFGQQRQNESLGVGRRSNAVKMLGRANVEMSLGDSHRCEACFLDVVANDFVVVASRS